MSVVTKDVIIQDTSTGLHQAKFWKSFYKLRIIH